MTEKIVLKLSGMHCSSCAINIDGELEDTEGVQSASTSFARQRVEVRFDPEKISLVQIAEIIKKAGYEVQT
jgi:P-type Cu+ transporter